MKRFFASFLFLFFVLSSVECVFGQAPAVRVPRPSQKASVMQTIGVSDVTIIYSRPSIKGRKIWGEPWAGEGEATLDNQNTRPKDAPIVPYNRVWRTGANEATQFIVTDDVWINGQQLKAGTYSLHSIPGHEDWTIIFNSDAGQWGSFTYDAKKDVLRVKAKPEMVADNQETLEYTFDPVTDNSAQVNIRWEKVRVPFTVAIKDVTALALEKARGAVAAAKPDDFQTPLAAARFAIQNKNTDDGMKWLEQSIKAKPTFGNLSAKANLLWANGNKEEALTVANQAIERGKADKVDTANFEKRVADMKAGKI